MALYRIDVESGSDKGTVVPDVGWKFNINLNQVNEAELKFSGTGEAYRANLAIGSTIYIYKDGTLAFKGLIDTTDYFVGGTVVFHASGWEVWMAKEVGAYAGSPWTSTASATIFSAIIAESSYLSEGTVEAGFSTDYRLTTSQSLWNAMSNLANKTSQDVSMDYTASPVEMSILDHTGSSTSVGVFNEGKEITNVRKSQGYPRGNIIIIKGKGDGAEQITATDNDATSISAYGSITKTIIDRSIMTTAEATSLAAAELALNKDPPTIYDFELTNPDFGTLNLGDIITLNALDQDVTNEEVRIVGIEEGEVNEKQYISLQTTNPELKTLMRTKNKIIAQIMKEQQDSNTYMQGSGNLSQWSSIKNVNNSNFMYVPFVIDSKFQDEAGNMRVASMTIDCEIAEYNADYGTVGESNKEPDLNSGTFSSSDNESTEVDVDTTFNNAITLANTWTNYKSWTTMVEHGEAQIFHTHVWVVDWDSPTNAASVYCRIKHVATGDYYPSSTGVRMCRGVTEEVTGAASAGTAHTHVAYNQLNGNCTIYVPIDPFGESFEVQLDTSDSGNATAGFFSAYYIVSQHKHGPGDYKTDLHKHDVVINEGLTSGSSINASGPYIQLQFYENKPISNNETAGAGVLIHMADTGTILLNSLVYFDGRESGNPEWAEVTSITEDVSITCTIATNKTAGDYVTWNTKYTRSYGGGSPPAPKTLVLNGIDMTFNDTYPHTTGYWRMGFRTNNASADLIHGTVDIKHELDN